MTTIFVVVLNVSRLGNGVVPVGKFCLVEKMLDMFDDWRYSMVTVNYLLM